MMANIYKFFRLFLLLILIPLLGDLHLGCAGMGGGTGGSGPLSDLNREITTPQGLGGITDPSGGRGPTRGGGGSAAPGWQDGQFPGRRPKEIFFDGKFCPAHPQLKVEVWEKRGNEDWKPTTVHTHYNPSDGTFYSWINRPGRQDEPVYPWGKWGKISGPDESVSIKFRAFHSDCFAGETPEQILPPVGKSYKGEFVLSNISQCDPSAVNNLKRCLGTSPERFEMAPKMLDSSSENEADPSTDRPPPGPKVKAGAGDATSNTLY